MKRFLNWLMALFGYKPAEKLHWLMMYEPHEKEPVILGEFVGSEEDAMDACQAAMVNWQWQKGGLKDGQMAMGRYGVLPIKRKIPEAKVRVPNPHAVTLVGGERIVAHPKNLCEGRPCCVHNPSAHHMKDFPQHWRDDTGVMERICPHRIGHPDPDDIAFRKRMSRGGVTEEQMLGVHGCDGCCRPTHLESVPETPPPTEETT